MPLNKLQFLLPGIWNVVMHYLWASFISKSQLASTKPVILLFAHLCYAFLRPTSLASGLKRNLSILLVFRQIISWTYQHGSACSCMWGHGSTGQKRQAHGSHLQNSILNHITMRELQDITSSWIYLPPWAGTKNVNISPVPCTGSLNRRFISELVTPGT